MKLSYFGREHLDVTTTDSTNGTLDISFDHGATWHPMEIVDATNARVLVAGPGAADNPAGTVVLQPGLYTGLLVRLTRFAEIVIREVPTVSLEVTPQVSPAAASAAICYPSWTHWPSAAERDALPGDVRTRAEALAWTTLQALTGYALTICPTSVRPCGANFVGGTWFEAPVTSTPFGPYVNARGEWVNTCSCGGMPVCSCGDLAAVQLPGPVGRIVEVKVDGVVVPATAYRVDDARDLVRTDGGLWPISQDMSKPDSEAGTFSVTYFRGHGPDQLTEMAAGRLAAEFSRAMTNASKCKLPAGVTAITRQGVTMEINTGLFPDGYTGIREVDAVIMALNPYGLKSPPRVVSPDSIRRGRTVTFGAR